MQIIDLIRLLSKKKDKVGSLANTTLDKFLKKTIALNLKSFAKTREVMARKICTPNHDNYHSVVNNILDISKLV